jgi:uncharacterized ion transporter superfamily protein YfcC
MAKTFKWVVLSIVCAVLAIFLYTTIDSEWSVKTNASIWLTIGFFASATLAILFAFSAVEGRDETSTENKTEKESSSQQARALKVKKLESIAS